MTKWLNLILQDGASPIIEQFIFFHDHALTIILIIITTVIHIINRIIKNKQTWRFILEGQIIEAIWTNAPAIISVFIAITSLRLLYLIDTDITDRFLFSHTQSLAVQGPKHVKSANKSDIVTISPTYSHVLSSVPYARYTENNDYYNLNRYLRRLSTFHSSQITFWRQLLLLP